MSEDEKIYSILFCGVGGQGSLLLAEITSLTAVRAGYDVKQTEVHGVSQRGGSVETHVRFGAHVWSPVVTPGKSDLVVALEKLEALRFAHFVNRDHGAMVVNDHEIIPGSVSGAAEAYPHDAIRFLQKEGLTVVVLPASQIARDLGDGRMANVVLAGAISSRLPIPEETWLETLRHRIPEKYRALNLMAFAAGRQLAHETVS